MSTHTKKNGLVITCQHFVCWGFYQTVKGLDYGSIETGTIKRAY